MPDKRNELTNGPHQRAHPIRNQLDSIYKKSPDLLAIIKKEGKV